MLLRSASSPLLGSLLSSSAVAEAHASVLPLPSPARRRDLGLRRAHSDANLMVLAAPVPRIPVTSPAFAAVDPVDVKEDVWGDWAAPEEPLFLSRGLGIDVGFPTAPGFEGGDRGRGGSPGGGGGGRGVGSKVMTGHGERPDLESFLRKLVEEHPFESLFLRNYAQFLYKTKKDVRKAEYYYSRAIMADPNDGEILAELGRLLWESYGDRVRALQYFERAVQASPDDCHVLGGYAYILLADGGDDCEERGGESAFAPMVMASAS